MELHGKYVFLGEGVRGSLTKEVLAKYDLQAGKDPQKFGLGMKEIWEIDPEKHREGKVMHTMGWPLGKNAGGGSFIYHLDNNQVYVGFVVHLNYENPYLYPYMEFQRFKHHPMVAELLKGGKRIAYGARAISEGGWQSMPKAVAPGVAILGCSRGPGERAAHQGQPQRDAVGHRGGRGRGGGAWPGTVGDELTAYDDDLHKDGPIAKDLKPVRNVKPLWSKYGLLGGVVLGGVDMWMGSLTGWNPFGTMRHGKSDAEATGQAAKNFKPIDYPKPDGVLSFDRLTNVSFSMTNHEESQPAHLTLKDAERADLGQPAQYAEPAQRYCPAGVYEVVEEDGKDRGS
jgi:electron-transferring-flavoprotein dehydrogenase